MSRLSTAIHNDLQLLALLRDELKLQSHLLGAELKTRWEELEREWSSLKEHVGRAEVATDKVAVETKTAIDLLVSSLKEGYAGIKRAVQR
jgi:hypothetical protein